jgi:hypothetical protein
MKRGQKDPTTGITDGEMPIFKGGRIPIAKIVSCGAEITCYETGEIERTHGQTGKKIRGFGSKNREGRLVLRVNGKTRYVHRIIYSAFHGCIPSGMSIDHIDGDPMNNCLGNLRLLTDQQNCQAFQKKRAGSTSRYRGVYWHKAGGKWMSRITVSGKENYIGSFSCEIEAAKAYDRAAESAGFLPEALNFNSL